MLEILQEDITHDGLDQKVVNFIDNFNNKEFKRNFRLKKSTFIALIQIFESQINLGRQISIGLDLLCLLNYLASGSFMFMTAHVMGMTKSTVHRAIHRAMNQILPKFSQVIRFPTNLNQVKRDFEAKFNMPGIIGCIDCVHVKIKSTSREVGEIFRNRKGDFSSNVQAVCMPDYMFYDAVVRWQGSAHDARIFEWSTLYNRLETRQLPGILLGDSGYPLLPFCLTPYRNPVTVQQNRKKINTYR